VTTSAAGSSCPRQLYRTSPMIAHPTHGRRSVTALPTPPTPATTSSGGVLAMGTMMELAVGVGSTSAGSFGRRRMSDLDEQTGCGAVRGDDCRAPMTGFGASLGPPTTIPPNRAPWKDVDSRRKKLDDSVNEGARVVTMMLAALLRARRGHSEHFGRSNVACLRKPNIIRVNRRIEVKDLGALCTPVHNAEHP
jgi:hypothetical protein